MRSNSVVLTVLLVSLLPVSMYANTQRWSDVQANAW